uniref:Proteinral transcription factor iiic polypeptide 1 alpha n=1 Tax=Ornithodoros turicata TaxID=34597 RepID=A0A2R5LKQ0_9ACAR
MDDTDFHECCIDEIALEGLDGITLEALWTRLQNRPQFPLAIDDDSKDFIWRTLIPDTRLRFYKLPTPRPKLIIYDRYQYLDPESGYVIEPDDLPEDPYPPKIITDEGVRGSCSTYYERVDVTNEVRASSQTSKEVEEQWGNTLVVVADQLTRERAIMGPNNSVQDMDLNDRKYAILERIGRSRYLGQTSQGKQDLTAFKETPANMFVHRKKLLQRNLVTKQVHYQKDSGGGSHTGSLMHLPRFYVERHTKMQVLIQEACRLLAAKPDKREVLQKIRADMGMKEGAFKKLLGVATPRYLNVRSMPFIEFFPNATEKECYTKNKKMRILRVVELVKYFQKGEEDEEEGDHAGEEDIIFFAPENFIYNLTPLEQAYRAVRKAGTAGISQSQLQVALTATKPEVRCLCKSLLKKGIVVTYMEDVGRQRVSKYFAKSIVPQSDVHKKYLVEKKRMMGHFEGQRPSKRRKLNEDISESGPSQPVSEENTMESTGTTESSHAEALGSVPQGTPAVTVETDGKLEFSRKKLLDNSKVSFANGLQDEKTKHNVKKVFSYKKLMRANHIIEYVSKEQLVSDTTKLLKHLHKLEAEAGFSDKCDRVSLERLLCKLCKEGLLKSFRTILRMGTKEKKLQLICHPSVTKDDEIFKTTIEQAKFKYFAIHREPKKRPGTVETPREEEVPKLLYNPQMSRVYGAEPKFRRMHICYAFMHYMIYSYNGKLIESGDPDAPAQYHEDISWRTFVSPLPKSPNTPEGWCMFSDILLSLPLSIFVKIVSSLKYKIDGIEEYLQDDVRRHYLIRCLPVKLRNALLFARRYIYSVHETIKRLAYIGLLTFGPQRLKEKDQVYLYLHRRIRIKDTTISLPGYHQISPDTEYPVKEYFLQTQDDVNDFWMSTEQICVHTPLGTVQTAMRGQTITLQNLYKKPAMVEAVRNREFHEAVDDGNIPGDQLGAAGFDSALFPHLKRNWTYIASVQQKAVTGKNMSSSSKVTHVKGYLDYMSRTSKEAKRGSTPKQQQKQRLGRLQAMISRIAVYYPRDGSSNAQALSMPAIASDTASPPKATARTPPAPRKNKEQKKSGEVVRVLRKRGWNKERRPYYDEKDKEALRSMKTLRVSWTTQEDIMLLFCKVASLFLDPHQAKMVVPFSCIRDIIHEYFPDISKDKTSRACQRRLHFIMLNPATAANVSVFLCEARQDKKLTEMFHGPKPPRSAEEQWVKMLRTVIEHLREKFSKGPAERLGDHMLPQTVAELKQRYNVIVSGNLGIDSWSCQEPHNVVDIHFNTVSLIIMSSFAADTGKSNWSLLLYRIYEQYPDKLIRSVSSRLKHKGVIAKKKCHAKKQLGSLSMSSLPFNLSNRFHYDLARRFLPECFSTMGELLVELFRQFHAGEKHTCAGNTDPSHAILLCNLIMSGNLTFSIEIPQTIVEFDQGVLDSVPCAPRPRRVPENLDDELPKDLEDEENAGLSEKSRTFRFETSGANVRTSRSFLYMLRQDMNKALELNTIRPQDYVAIRPCRVECSVRDDRFLPTCHVEAPTDKSYRMKIRSPVFDRVVQTQRTCIPPSYTSKDFVEDTVRSMFSHDQGLARKLYAWITQKKELGVVFSAICAEFSTEDTSKLREVLSTLVDEMAVVVVGVKCFRYVAAPYGKPWMVKSFKIPKDLRSRATSLGEEAVHRAKRPRVNAPDENVQHGISEASRSEEAGQQESQEDTSKGGPSRLGQMVEVEATSSEELIEVNMEIRKCSMMDETAKNCAISDSSTSDQSELLEEAENELATGSETSKETVDPDVSSQRESHKGARMVRSEPLGNAEGEPGTLKRAEEELANESQVPSNTPHPKTTARRKEAGKSGLQGPATCQEPGNPKEDSREPSAPKRDRTNCSATRPRSDGTDPQKGEKDRGTEGEPTEEEDDDQPGTSTGTPASRRRQPRNSRGSKDSSASPQPPPEHQERRGNAQKRTYYETASRNLNLDAVERILFVPRLWKKPDGTLNRSMFHTFLSATLSHIMDNPGITEDELAGSFSKQTEPPVQLLECVSILERLHCVRRHHLRGYNSRCTLFSKRRDMTIEETYRPGDKAFFEATEGAVAQFAAFTSHFLKTRDAT